MDFHQETEQVQAGFEVCVQDMKSLLEKFSKSAEEEKQRVLRDMSASWNEMEVSLTQKHRRAEDEYTAMIQRLRGETDRLQAEKAQLEGTIERFKEELKRIGLLGN